MTRPSEVGEIRSRCRGGALLASSASHQQQSVNEPDAMNLQKSQQQGQSERTPLLNSMGAAAGSLVNNSVVVGSMQQGVSWGMAAFLLVNTALGAGMLNYPFAYNQIGGILSAALMQVILLVFISSTMFILVYCADFNQDDTYHDVLLSMCGKRAQQISALSILLTCYGINVTFLVIIGDQYDRMFISLAPEYLDEYWFLDRKFTIFLTSLLFIWPMCYAQRLDFLRYASVLGMFAMLYVAFLTVYEHYVLDEATIEAVAQMTKGSGESLLQPATNSTTSTPNGSATTTTTTTTNGGQANQLDAAMSQTSGVKMWLEPLAIVPVLCFAYQTHEVIVPVYACMRQRSIANFMKASFFGLVILFFLYNLVGAFGYLTFGERVGPDIMSLYDAQDPIVLVGIVALVVKFITTYPPLMFCGRSALDGLYGEFRQLSTAEFKQNERSRRIVISTLWFLSTVALAIFAPDISVTLQLLGSMASINVFVFPGMCLISLTHRLRRARHAILMGELPPDCQVAGDFCFHQRAKDYHLISGSYLGAAMRRRQQLQQQQYTLSQNSLRNHLMNSGSHFNGQNWPSPSNGLTGSATNANSCANFNCNSGNKQHGFTATFASLIEFENNLIKSTCLEDEQHLHKRHNSLLPNGHSSQTATASAPAASLSSDSSSFGLQLSSTSAHQALEANGKTVTERNEFEELDERRGLSSVDGRAGQSASRSAARGAELDGLIADKSSGAATHGRQSTPIDSNYASGPINESHEDYSDCEDPANHRRQTQRNTNQQQQVLASLSSSFKQFVAGNQKLQSLSYAEPLLTSTNDKRSNNVGPLCCKIHHNKHQCLQSMSSNNIHQAELSITNSLLNKFGSSIAPSTVAQIGISRCAALGLYSFAGLLIAFGAFIFVLELANVFGLLAG